MSLSDRLRTDAGRHISHSLVARFLFIGLVVITITCINLNKKGTGNNKVQNTGHTYTKSLYVADVR